MGMMSSAFCQQVMASLPYFICWPTFFQGESLLVRTDDDEDEFDFSMELLLLHDGEEQVDDYVSEEEDVAAVAEEEPGISMDVIQREM